MLPRKPLDDVGFGYARVDRWDAGGVWGCAADCRGASPELGTGASRRRSGSSWPVARKVHSPLSSIHVLLAVNDLLTAVIDRVRLLNMPTGGKVNYLIEIRRHAISSEGIEDFQRYYSPIRLTRPTNNILSCLLAFLVAARQAVMRTAVEPNDVPFAVEAHA